MESKRSSAITLGMFDLMKGLGLIGVILEHTITFFQISFQPLLSFNAILTNGLMPFFFFVSGFGIKKRKPLSFLQRNARELLLPYGLTLASLLLFSPLCFRLLAGSWANALPLYQKLFNACLLGASAETASTLVVGPIWFLLALFWGENLINLILHLPERWQAVGVIGLIGVSQLLAAWDVWYYCLPAGCLATGFLYLGYVAKKRKWLQQCMKWPVWLISFLLCCASLLVPRLSVHNAEASHLLLQYPIAGGTGLFFLLCGLWMNRFSCFPFNVLRWLGRHSLWGLCAHTFELFCIPTLLLLPWLTTPHPHMGFAALLLVRVLLTGAGCVLIVYATKWFRSHKRRMMKQKKGATV